MPTRGVPIVVQHGGLSTEEKQQLDELGIPTLRGKHQRSDASCEARINFRVAGTVAASARPALLAALPASACTSIAFAGAEEPFFSVVLLLLSC